MGKAGAGHHQPRGIFMVDRGEEATGGEFCVEFNPLGGAACVRRLGERHAIGDGGECEFAGGCHAGEADGDLAISEQDAAGAVVGAMLKEASGHASAPKAWK